MAESQKLSNSVLVAEDDADVRDILAELIGELTSPVFAAKDGIDAYEQLKRQPVDLLVTDINMPGLDGITLLEKAVTEKLSKLSMVVTGFGSREEVKRALLAGVYDFIEKPFEDEIVSHRIRMALETINVRFIEQRALELIFRHFYKGDPGNSMHLTAQQKNEALDKLLKILPTMN